MLLQITDHHHKNMKTSNGVLMSNISEKLKRASFSPSVFFATGGLAYEANTFYKFLAPLLSSKWGDSYSVSLSFLFPAVACT